MTIPTYAETRRTTRARLGVLAVLAAAPRFSALPPRLRPPGSRTSVRTP